MPTTSSLKFEKIVPEGKALGYLDGRACFVLGPLPGETAEVSVTAVHPRYATADLQTITEPSPHRHEPAEKHYLLCSPWQGVEYSYQLELKRTMAHELFARPGLNLEFGELAPAPKSLHYRNKLRFALISDAEGRPALALHERLQNGQFVPAPDGCALGSEAMNEAAQSAVARLSADELDADTQLIVRQSRQTGDVATILTNQTDDSMMLTDTVLGVPLSYPVQSFFQTNLDVFELAAADVRAAVPKGAEVVDLYGGVGTLGLIVAARAAHVVGLEVDAAAANQAKANALGAGVKNYQSLTMLAERIPAATLAKADCVIVDPPRAGLSRQVVEALRTAHPKRIIYLSCNPITQVRDLLALNDLYQADTPTGYDMYPGTPHMETLVILNRRAT